MAFDPEDILGSDPGKGVKSSPGFDVSDIHAAAQAAGSTNNGKRELIGGTIDPNTNFDQFRFQPKTNADNYLLRAQDQGFWESLGKTIGNTVANIPIDVVQGIGYLATLPEIGDDRDYSNALVSQLEKLKNPLGEVYREHPEKTFDMGDSAWWMENLGGLVESAASFAIEGAGVSKIFAEAAKAAAWSVRAAKVGSKIAQGLSATALTYTEGAMSGAQVYETAYNNNYNKLYSQGMNPADADIQAKHIASQAAAATVQLHTALNLALNVTGLTPIFRDTDQSIVRWWRKNGAKLPGETPQQWEARIAELTAEATPLKNILGLGMTGPARLGLEAVQEGVEEVNTQYAEHVGKAIGEGKEKKDVTGRLHDAGRYFDEVLNQEGALNMVLGALGGLAQTAIMDHIPIHKVVKYGPDGNPVMVDGKPETERISSHTMNERMDRQYFDSIGDALGKDMSWFSAKNKELQDALVKKDLAAAARAKADLLSVHNLRAISLGLGDVWKQQYSDIAQLDNTKSLADALDQPIAELDKQIEEDRGAGDMEGVNEKSKQRYELQQQQNSLRDVTEAVQKGFADSKSDNSYKEKAQQAIKNLDYLTKLYEDMHDKYSGTPELDQSDLADHMFYRHANLFLHKQQVDNIEKDLTQMRARLDEIQLNEGDDLLVRQSKQFLNDKEVWDDTVKKLNNDISRLNTAIKANGNSVVKQLLDKYKIPATKEAISDLVDALERRKADLQKRAEFSNKELSDTIQVWKEMNPDKTVDDVLKKASQRPVLEDIYQQNRKYHQQAISEYETAKSQLGKDSTNDAVKRYLKENDRTLDKKQAKKDQIEAYDQQMDREIAATMDAKQKQAKVSELDGTIAQNVTAVNNWKKELAAAQRLLKSKTGFKNVVARANLKWTIADLQERINQSEYQIKKAQDRKNALAQEAAQATQAANNVSRNPPPVSQPVDKPTASTTPAPNTTEQVQEAETYDQELPDFDFGQEAIPSFTTVEEGNRVFDNIVGGNEAGTTLRQFIEIRKNEPVEFLLEGTKRMIAANNLPLPNQQEMDSFVRPYITALKNHYLEQRLNPTEEYEAIKDFLNEDMLDELDQLELDAMNKGFSYDRVIAALNKQSQKGNIQKNMIGLVASRLKAHVEFLQQPVVEEQESIPEETPASQSDIIYPEAERRAAKEDQLQKPVKEINENPTTYISPAADTEPTTFSNGALDLEVVQQQNRIFVGAQNIEAVKANFNTNPYKEFTVGNKIKIVADYTRLDPTLNTDVLLPGVIAPGDEVSFVVDEQWSGGINYDTDMVQDDYGEQLRRADTFQNYLETPDKIGMGSSAQHPKGAHANVPIKIVHTKTGKVIGYVPRADWVIAKYPNTDNYRNVTDNYKDGEYEVTDNVARQYARIIKLRESVVRAWNTNKNLQLKSFVSKRGTGHVMLNRETNPNTGNTKLVNRSAKNMLPDTSLEISIIKGGTPYVANGAVSNKRISSRLPEYMKNATSLPVAMLPAADGNFIPTPLYTHRLGDNPSSLNTIVSAISIYLRNASGLVTAVDTKTATRIADEVGFDIRTEKGLRDFMQQYFTYTQKFGEKDTVITPSEVTTKAIPEFMLDIPDLQPGEKVAFIKVGTSFSGEKPIYAQLINGELHPDFEQALRDGLSNRFKNVVFPGKGLRGINSQGEFKAPIIKKDGNVQINKYHDYNEFVKASSTTFAYGLNKVGNKFVYTANPVIQLDYDQALRTAPPVISTSLPKTATQDIEEAAGEDMEEPDELADLFGNGILSPSPGSVVPLSIPAGGEKVSLELLQELRNLTPEAHRNTKTPESVLRELLERGITVLADGHNPFYTC